MADDARYFAFARGLADLPRVDTNTITDVRYGQHLLLVCTYVLCREMIRSSKSSTPSGTPAKPMTTNAVSDGYSDCAGLTHGRIWLIV